MNIWFSIQVLYLLFYENWQWYHFILNLFTTWCCPTIIYLLLKLQMHTLSSNIFCHGYDDDLYNMTRTQAQHVFSSGLCRKQGKQNKQINTQPTSYYKYIQFYVVMIKYGLNNNKYMIQHKRHSYTCNYSSINICIVIYLGILWNTWLKLVSAHGSWID